MRQNHSRSGSVIRCLSLLPVVACVLLTALSCAAANRTWSGASGIDNYWMTHGNWQFGVAPSPGDNLIFPGVMSGGNLTNHNNYPDGTVFGNISIGTSRGQDYSIGGNRVVLTNGLSGGSIIFGAGGAFVYFDITLSNSQAFTASGSLILNNTIDSNGYSLIVSNTGSVLINGVLTNSQTWQYEYSLIKTNTGTLTISSSGTISPEPFIAAQVAGGTLVMDGVAETAEFDAGQGNLVVNGTIATLGIKGDASISGTGNIGTINQYAGSITITPGNNGEPGVLDVDSLLLTNESLESGELVLQIVIDGTTPGTDYSQLLVTTNAYTLSTLFNYPAELALQWNYSPQLGDSFLVLAQEPPTGDRLYTGAFAGLPGFGIVDETNGASLGVLYATNGVLLTTLRIASSPFVLWKGGYGPRDWSVTTNWAQGVGPASGDVLIFSQYQMGNFTFQSPPPVTNDLPSGTSLAGLAFTSPTYTVFGNPITVTGGITNNTAGGTNVCHVDVAAVGALSLDVEPGGSFLMDGVIAGNGTVSKTGTGLLIYSGVTSGAFVGAVAVSNGTLQVDGSFTDGSFTVNGGTLGGTGAVSTLTVNSGGTLKPGDSPGVLHVQGNLTMAPGAVFETEIYNPISGSGYDQLQVSGGVNLNGATLNLHPNFAAVAGAAFLILVNNGGGAITGTFAGLPEGAVFQTGGQYFSISYQAGSGNRSVVVTRINPQGRFTGIVSLPPVAVQLLGTGAINATYTILANTNLANTNWVNIGTASANSSGYFFFSDSNVLAFPQRFYQIQSP